ncbi:MULTISPECIES: type II toxin-antitoxin system RelE/ParE family toxin [unclassified Kaistella]|uniref:type II toxin-antitoxin system RelE/ParE family toxin n=1 Tax=unclassified Kaistella TaxID=2762626 RepID=UPI0027374F2B|nr:MULTISPECIES: type II toxin-antitoxin system RelE/ParE family toxin [unclassified Kaistella]MDP2452904.1 type II toxin-antitoxin system RelE/ParE family toxin [Kaistella sp. SH11-4b]MDP2455813.1 type II toxin-antitoxin system RelE/ParE family toxin [Kaistella sp. SH40-3]MDP2458717.1 type II toxin-antitoxin system RelE/ParE family toxin [Kaistella sp. SH19-2b]
MKKVSWSIKASKELNEVYDYWTLNNNSNIYSEKILDETFRMINLVRSQSYIGEESKIKRISRVLILENFSLFYRSMNDEIKVLSFFDNRLDPGNLKIN